MKQRLSYVLALLTPLMNLSQNAAAQNASPFWSLEGNNNASSSSKLGTTNAVNLSLFTNNTERLRILSSNGNVGIGTLTPTERLRINGPAGINPMRVQVNSATKFSINQNGGVAIGLSVVPPANGLYVAGKVGLGVKEPTARLDIAGTNGNVTLVNLTDGNIRVHSEFSDDSQSIGISSSDFIGVKGSGWYGIWGSGIAGVYGEGTAGVTGVAIDDGSSYGGFFKSNYVALHVEGRA
ncbi:MAG TPA: hypothetical protein VLC28_04085, partial [Flavitalea sp.]|nr:hypothetical protein [Flavitalea sp.]